MKSSTVIFYDACALVAYSYEALVLVRAASNSAVRAAGSSPNAHCGAPTILMKGQCIINDSAYVVLHILVHPTLLLHNRTIDDAIDFVICPFFVNSIYDNGDSGLDVTRMGKSLRILLLPVDVC